MADMFANSTSSTPQAHWVPEPNGRGTWSILLTCLTTLGLCVWSSLHPHIPTTDTVGQYVWSGLPWKIMCMIGGMLFPEFLAFSAFAQYFAARELKDRVQDLLPSRLRPKRRGFWSWIHRPHRNSVPEEPKADDELVDETVSDRDRFLLDWTLVHSFYVIMGGYTFSIKDMEHIWPDKDEDEMMPLALDGEKFLYVLEKDPYLIPFLTKKEIQALGSGSGLAIILICIQALWFVIQVIARLSQQLSLSLLELNTFGHCILAFAAYAAWFQKPLDIPYSTTVSGGKSREMLCLLRFVTPADETGDSPGIFIKSMDNVELMQKEYRAKFSKILTAERKRKDDVKKNKWAWNGTSNIFSRPPVCCLYQDEKRWKESRFYAKLTGGEVSTESQLEKCTNEAHGKDESGEKEETVVAVQPVAETSTEPDSALFERTLLSSFETYLGSSVDEFKSLCKRLEDEDKKSLRWATGLIIALTTFSILYGGIHAIAWNATFPTAVQRILWRCSVVTIAGCCAFLALIWPLYMIVFGLEEWLRVQLRSPSQGQMSRGLLITLYGPAALLFLIVFLLYMVPFFAFFAARAYIIVESFIQLAYLPPSAYSGEIQWSNYFPHIG